MLEVKILFIDEATSKKPALKFSVYIFAVRPHPSNITSWHHSLDNCFSFFTTLLFLCIIVTKSRRILYYLKYLLAEAAHTYFESVSGKERMQESGKYSSKCEVQRKKNRKERVSKSLNHTVIIPRLCIRYNF